MSTTIVTHVPFRLREEILALSVADTWDAAKLEWNLLRVYFADGLARCVCGHPISECCEIVNLLNGNEAVVGNVCVAQFLGLDSEAIFRGLRKISADIGAALSNATIDHAHNQGWVTSWEVGFYRDTARKRRLSAKQRAIRVQINEKVLVRCMRGGSVYA